MVLGGYLSDRFGRRRTLALYLASMSLPVLYLMMVLQQHGWVMPVPQAPADRAVPAALVTALWIARAHLRGGDGPDVRHPLGDLHGRHQPGGGGHAVHRLHGADEPVDRLLGHLAGHRDRSVRLSGHDVDRRHRRACSAWRCCRGSAPCAATRPTAAHRSARASVRWCSACACIAWLPYRLSAERAGRCRAAVRDAVHRGVRRVGAVSAGWRGGAHAGVARCSCVPVRGWRCCCC